MTVKPLYKLICLELKAGGTGSGAPTNLRAPKSPCLKPCSTLQRKRVTMVMPSGETLSMASIARAPSSRPTRLSTSAVGSRRPQATSCRIAGISAASRPCEPGWPNAVRPQLFGPRHVGGERPFPLPWARRARARARPRVPAGRPSRTHMTTGSGAQGDGDLSRIRAVYGWWPALLQLCRCQDGEIDHALAQLEHRHPRPHQLDDCRQACRAAQLP